MKKGLVSITFRGLDRETIAGLCVKNGLLYMEWGGDVHVPAGDIRAAEETAELCRRTGIIPVGYGSYYNAASDFSGFGPALQSAAALGASYIRIWAGKGKAYDQKAKENIRRAVDSAADKGVSVSLECHRNTMTEDPDLAVSLAESCGCLLHFQPNPDISFERNLYALRISAPYLCACHVFAWERGDIRLPLSAHAGIWEEYAKEAKDVPYLLEFTADNSAGALVSDAAALHGILENASV